MRHALLPLLLVLAVQTLPADPASHLATVPAPGAQEKEVISLVQWSPSEIGGAGIQVVIPVYNPTKYILTSCVARFTAKDKTERVYFSNPTGIAPFKDGNFVFTTRLPDVQPGDLKYEILQLTYKEPDAKKTGRN